MMKTIYIVFNNRQKTETCMNLFDDLRFVFESFANVKICFLDEIEPGDIDDGDLYLVLYKDRVYPMREYISSLDKVMVMARTFERKYLDEVYALASGTEVLVVNDSRESTIQTTNSLYELGLNHLNLIPYMIREDDGRYDHIKVAITPAEEDLVPSYIEHIINVHNRCIDTNTFVTIINKLNLNNREVTRNLLSYIQRTTGSTGKRYITDSIKDQMLKQTIQESRESVIILDNSYNIVHYNDKADITFNLAGSKALSLKEIFEDVFLELFATEDYSDKFIKFQNNHYIVAKTTIRVMDQIIGYSLRFSAETDIKNLEIDINKQLMKRGLVAKYIFDDIIYKSDVMKKTVGLAKKIAVTDYTVLINGESGTGKELLAQSIHNFSRRKEKPFVAINCAALPESLLESELFGYEKGAFTGASPQGKIGLFEQANRGTIFLDEIGDMSLNLQARLLRVLQEKQITRIGSDKVINLDIRVVAATNKNLSDAIKNREFREDLYYRLCNIPITMPALREKKEDISLLFRCFVGEKFDEMSALEKAAMENYRWPGNVRELRNAADYYITLGELPAAVLSAAKAPAFSGYGEIPTDAKSIAYAEAPATARSFAYAEAPATAPAYATNIARAVGFAPGPNYVECAAPAPGRAPADQLETLVMSIISAHTTELCGIGRTSILNELRARGIKLSDDKLRKLIRKLEAENKIKVGRGRVGCMRI